MNDKDENKDQDWNGDTQGKEHKYKEKRSFLEEGRWKI